ncbi:hypothetical protein COBT_000922 [Conglomerata obtusa]
MNIVHTILYTFLAFAFLLQVSFACISREKSPCLSAQLYDSKNVGKADLDICLDALPAHKQIETIEKGDEMINKNMYKNFSIFDLNQQQILRSNKIRKCFAYLYYILGKIFVCEDYFTKWYTNEPNQEKLYSDYRDCIDKQKLPFYNSSIAGEPDDEGVFERLNNNMIE